MTTSADWCLVAALDDEKAAAASARRCSLLHSLADVTADGEGF